LDHRVSPPFKPSERAEPLELLVLVGQQLLGLQCDDVAYQGFFIWKVAVQLRLTGAADSSDVVERCRRHASGVHQLGGRLQNSGSGGRSPPRQLRHSGAALVIRHGIRLQVKG
jgi:hypothetical protein